MKKNNQKRVRIEDVAAHAGVSMKSVSRVLNNEPNVREATRKKVLESVKQLDYRPNISARSLAGNKSYLICLFYGPASPSYLMNVQTGALGVCSKNNYGLVMHPCELSSDDMARDVDLFLRQNQFDGIILIPPIADNPIVLKVLNDMDIPYVRVSPNDPDVGSTVIIDDDAATSDLMNHLMDLGHQRIAIIKGPDEHGASNWRYKSYQKALQSRGLDSSDELVAQGDFTYTTGEAAAKKLLSLPKRPTAIFACNDEMAIGAIHAIQDEGLNVPKDISVVGFDDAPIASQTRPMLTTIHQPMRRLGSTAAESLLSIIGGKERDLRSVLEYEMVIRSSTAQR